MSSSTAAVTHIAVAFIGWQGFTVLSLLCAAPLYNMNTKELAVCSVFLFVGTVQGFSGGSSLSIYQTTHRFPSTCTTTGTHSATAVAAAASKDDDGTTTSDADNDVAMEKAIKAMTAFTNKYLENTNTKLCSDKSVASVVIKGLAEHKLAYSSPLCPCRFYEDKQAEAKDGYWNCPCVPM